jgi:hypothetical protein
MAVVLNNALSLAELAGAYEKKASDVIASYQQRDQMAVEKRASTLKLLVDLGFVPQGREKEAADLLSSHANTLELLENLAHKTAGYRKQASAAPTGDLGRAVGEKQAGLASRNGASYDSLNGVVGGKTSEIKASDLPLMKLAGLAG